MLLLMECIEGLRHVVPIPIIRADQVDEIASTSIRQHRHQRLQRTRRVVKQTKTQMDQNEIKIPDLSRTAIRMIDFQILYRCTNRQAVSIIGHTPPGLANRSTTGIDTN